MDLVNGRSPHLPVVARVGHFEPLIRRDYAHVFTRAFLLRFSWIFLGFFFLFLLILIHYHHLFLLGNGLFLRFHCGLNWLELCWWALVRGCSGDKIEVAHRGKHLLVRVIGCIFFDRRDLLCLGLLRLRRIICSILTDRFSLAILTKTRCLVRDQVDIRWVGLFLDLKSPCLSKLVIFHWTADHLNLFHLSLMSNSLLVFHFFDWTHKIGWSIHI